MLRPLGRNHALTACGSLDSIDDLVPRHSLGDESLCTVSQCTTYCLGLVGKAEHHDGSVVGHGAEGTYSLVESLDLSVGVEQCDIDASPRRLPNVEFDNLDLGFAGLQERPQTLEDDHVVVDERDSDRFGHDRALRPIANGGADSAR